MLVAWRVEQREKMLVVALVDEKVANWADQKALTMVEMLEDAKVD